MNRELSAREKRINLLIDQLREQVLSMTGDVENFDFFVPFYKAVRSLSILSKLISELHKMIDTP